MIQECTTTVQDFLAKLEAFNERDVSKIKNRSKSHSDGKWYLTNGSPDDPDQDVQELISLANEHLVKNDGQCYWINHERLKVHGFPVTCGERDSFGWLTGCVHTKHGIFVFG
jgi:hypothetical protein